MNRLAKIALRWQSKLIAWVPFRDVDGRLMMGNKAKVWAYLLTGTTDERRSVMDCYQREGFTIPVHSHDVDEFVVLLAGRMECVRYDRDEIRTFSVSPGDTFEADAGVHHSALALEDSRYLLVYTPGIDIRIVGDGEEDLWEA